MDKTMKMFKREERKRKLKQKVNEVIQFHEEHPWVIPVVLTVGAYSVKAISKGVAGYKTHVEVNHRNCEHWDPRVGEYFTSKRKLTSAEQDKLNQLYASGLTKGEALSKMGLRK